MMDAKFWEAVVVYPVRNVGGVAEVLLARKVAKIGAGKFNGYGGGRENDETLLACAVRETFDECGLRIAPEGLAKVGEIDFHNQKDDGSEYVVRVHFYLSTIHSGEPHDTTEMTDPRWYSVAALPLADMMPADALFVPQMLEGKRVRGMFRYAPGQSRLIASQEIAIVDGW